MSCRKVRKGSDRLDLGFAAPRVGAAPSPSSYRMSRNSPQEQAASPYTSLLFPRLRARAGLTVREDRF